MDQIGQGKEEDGRLLKGCRSSIRLSKNLSSLRARRDILRGMENGRHPYVAEPVIGCGPVMAHGSPEIARISVAHDNWLSLHWIRFAARRPPKFALLLTSIASVHCMC